MDYSKLLNYKVKTGIEINEIISKINNTDEIKEILFNNYIKIVDNIVRNIDPNHEYSYEDLFQEGCYGLLYAINNFVNNNDKFFSETYAYLSIKRYIISYMKKNMNNDISFNDSSLYNYEDINSRLDENYLEYDVYRILNNLENISARNKEMYLKYLGIGFEKREVSELCKEYNISRQRIHDLINRINEIVKIKLLDNYDYKSIKIDDEIREMLDCGYKYDIYNFVRKNRNIKFCDKNVYYEYLRMYLDNQSITKIIKKYTMSTESFLEICNNINELVKVYIRRKNYLKYVKSL